MPLQEQSLKHKVKIPAVHLYMKLGIMPKCQLHKPTGPGHSSATSTWHMQGAGSQSVQEMSMGESAMV